METVIEFRLTDTQWGDVLFLRPIPRNKDSWGILRNLEGTVWYDLIPVISNDILQHALVGHIMPLMREIGPPPLGLCKKLPREEGLCSLHKTCLIYHPVNCVPSLKLPLCYEPPNLEGDAKYAALLVASAWREGRHVIVVSED